jgi:hypothetical protein
MIASMVIAFKRCFAMMFGVITGKLFFHEKNLTKKLSVASIVGMGVVIMHIGPLFSSLFASPALPEEIHASSPLPENSKKIYLTTTFGVNREFKKSKQNLIF